MQMTYVQNVGYVKFSNYWIIYSIISHRETELKV